ncbi:MAG: RsmE family RNA methyltransferase [Gemmatimonadaceae bacterium]
MERVDRPTVATFHAGEPLAPGATVVLGEDAAHHARVRRLEVGERVVLTDGAGAVAQGTLVRLSKHHAAVDVASVERRDPPPAVHLLVPVADRDRMLWLAEKSVELAATSWRPVLWRRSRSVSPRGEGTAFQGKVRARMSAALTQCEGAWLPHLFPDATPERAVAAAPEGTRLVLDADAPPLLTLLPLPLDGPVTLAVGPEGGLEREERERLVAAGFAPASLGGHILRFETAAVAALAVVRASLAAAGSLSPDLRPSEPHG